MMVAKRVDVERLREALSQGHGVKCCAECEEAIVEAARLVAEGRVVSADALVVERVDGEWPDWAIGAGSMVFDDDSDETADTVALILSEIAYIQRMRAEAAGETVKGAEK